MASSFSLNSFSLQSMSPIGEHSSVLRLFSVYQIRLTRLPLLCAPPLFPAPLWPGHCRDWAIAGVCRPLSNRRKCRPCPHPVGTRPSLSNPPCVPPHSPCHGQVIAVTLVIASCRLSLCAPPDIRLVMALSLPRLTHRLVQLFPDSGTQILGSLTKPNPEHRNRTSGHDSLPAYPPPRQNQTPNTETKSQNTTPDSRTRLPDITEP